MNEFLIYTIDDDVDFNMILKLAMKKYDIRIKTHTSAVNFTKSVKIKEPDLCILDLNLDNQGEGFQLLKAMRNVIGDTLPIFIMSRRGERGDVLKAMELGATDFIPKPLDDKYLLLKLKEYFLDNKEIQSIEHNYSKLQDEDRNAAIKMEFSIINVGIDLLEVEGDIFLTKEMNLKFSGNVIEDIFSERSLNFKVIDSWQVEVGKFRAKLEKELSIQQVYSVRRWIIQKSLESNY